MSRLSPLLYCSPQCSGCGALDLPRYISFPRRLLAPSFCHRRGTSVRYWPMTTATLSIMVNPRVRAIREAKAKRLRNEREAQVASGAVAVVALLAVAAMLLFGPY